MNARDSGGVDERFAAYVRDRLSFTKLQEVIGLAPGNLITHLRKLEDAGYVTTEKNGSGVTARTSVARLVSGMSS
jgi:DNA-binding transcriptional ArsR family regulator